MGLVVVDAALEAFLDGLDPFTPAFYVGRGGAQAGWHLKEECRLLQYSVEHRAVNQNLNFTGIHHSKVGAMRASPRHPCKGCVKLPKRKRRPAAVVARAAPAA